MHFKRDERETVQPEVCIIIHNVSYFKAISAIGRIGITLLPVGNNASRSFKLQDAIHSLWLTGPPAD